MILAALIRKRTAVKEANANPANAANDEKVSGEPLAKLAALALASKGVPDATATRTEQSLPSDGQPNMETVSRCWLVHYPNRESVKSFSSAPGATRAEILALKPGAIAAEPFEMEASQASKPMRANDEAMVLAWLARVDETDANTIADVLNQCRRDAGLRQHIIQLQKESNYANH